MNKQEIFDTIVNHLLTQNKKSMNVNNTFCAYRGANSLQCAVGCLISDEAYDSSFEREGVATDIIIRALIKSGIPVDNEFDNNDILNLLSVCQSIHDRKDPDSWAYSLQNAAIEYRLEFNPPKS